MSVMHANRYDTIELWCEADTSTARIAGGNGPPDELTEVTCGDCLVAILAYGDMAAKRIRAIRPKDWNACPYEAHANDCDCGGRMGDR
jgi:hypothetical protein